MNKNINSEFLCLGIESSCDETAASVILNGRTVLSNVINSQANLHKEYGGVVPEIASRLHVESILPVIDKALDKANKKLEDIDLVAVTYGPGLVGALLVGISAAKGICQVTGIPMVGVNHIQGHIAANLINNEQLTPPFICLVASGGHSNIVLVKEDFTYEIIAKTRDDAPGEAFDKIARACGLGYPGGPLIDLSSREGNPYAIEFPKTKFSGDSLDFSFSGVKTAALNYLNRMQMQAIKDNIEFSDIFNLADFTASFQQSIVDVLAENTVSAALRYNQKIVCIAGGVSANYALRKKMKELCENNDLTLYVPELILCTDNAAMIASAGTYSYWSGKTDDMDLNAIPSLSLE